MEIALAAVAVLGALVGTALGAWLNARSAAQIEARRAREIEQRRRQETRGAARLVYSELGAAAIAAESDARALFVLGIRSISTDAWISYRAVLAAELPDEVYDVVAEACTKLTWLVTMLSRDVGPGDVPDEMAASLKEVEQVCRQAQDALVPLAYPDYKAASPDE